jgi:hypothetical protein
MDIDNYKERLIKVITDSLGLGYIDRAGRTVWRERFVTNATTRLNIDFMLRGYFDASRYDLFDALFFKVRADSAKKLGQHTLGASFKPKAFQLILSKDTAIWSRAYYGYKVYLVNDGDDTIYLPTQDYRLYMNVQALAPDGIWRDIEDLPRSWCNMSYFSVTMPPGQCWDFIMPQYEGQWKTKLRISLTYRNTAMVQKGAKNETLYSNIIDGSINAAQFWRKEGHSLLGLMDTYVEQ